MARVEVVDIAFRATNPVTFLAGASVQINIRGGGAATHYPTEVGGSGSTASITTDSAGRIEGRYVDEDEDYEFVITKNNQSHTQPWVRGPRGPAGPATGGMVGIDVTAAPYNVVPDAGDCAAAIRAAIDDSATMDVPLPVLLPGGRLNLTTRDANGDYIALPSDKLVPLLGAGAGTPVDYTRGGTVLNVAADTNPAIATSTATTTSGSPNLTVVSPTTNWENGMRIAGTGIPDGTIILSGAGTSTMVLSKNATASASGVTVTGGLSHVIRTEAGVQPYFIQGVSIFGPRLSSAVGAYPSLFVDGIKAHGRGAVRDVQIIGCNSGLIPEGDHQELTNVVSQANYIGADWKGWEAGYGDQRITRCNFTSNTKASIGIGRDGQILGSIFEATHLGSGPLSIWCYEKTTNAKVLKLGNVEFRGCSFEAAGNGTFRDERYAQGLGSENTIQRVDFGMSSSAGTFDYPSNTDGTIDQDASFVIGTMQNVNALDGSIFAVGDVAAVKADWFSDVFVDNAKDLLTAVLAAGVPFVADGASQCYGIRMIANGVEYNMAVLIATTGAVAADELVMRWGPNAYKTATPSIPLGIVHHAAADGAPVLYARRSTGAAVNAKVTAGVALARGDFLKQDTSNAGAVTKASDPNDGAIVGCADYASASPPTTVNMLLAIP